MEFVFPPTGSNVRILPKVRQQCWRHHSHICTWAYITIYFPLYASILSSLSNDDLFQGRKFVHIRLARARTNLEGKVARVWHTSFSSLGGGISAPRVFPILTRPSKFIAATKRSRNADNKDMRICKSQKTSFTKGLSRVGDKGQL